MLSASASRPRPRVRERLAASPEGAGALQQALQSRRENEIAGIDRVLDVADQMREADLVSQPGPAHLAAIAVGDPMMGAVIAQEGRHHRRGVAFGGDKDGALGMGEHPEPPVRPPDPHPSLVRSPDRAGEKPRLDQARLGRKRRPAGVEDIDQRAFADVEPEQGTQHSRASGMPWTERR